MRSAPFHLLCGTATPPVRRLHVHASAAATVRSRPPRWLPESQAILGRCGPLLCAAQCQTGVVFKLKRGFLQSACAVPADAAGDAAERGTESDAGDAAHSTAEAAEPAVAEEGDFVQVHYTGSLEDGTVFDNSREESESGRERGEPLSFLLGAGQAPGGVEGAVLGVREGGRGHRRLEVREAYGDWLEGMTAKIPRAEAPDNVQYGRQVGDHVTLQSGAEACISEVSPEHVTIDANHPLAGEPLLLEVELLKLTKASALEKATLAAGCFWGPELAFQRVPGVLATVVGYSQGFQSGASYEQVCSGVTGHVEAVQVTFDPEVVCYEQILDRFFRQHDPTQLNRQGGDVGTQYRSGIYWHSDEQREIGEAALEYMHDKLGGTVVTELEEVKNFTRAEEYHQQFLERGGRFEKPQSAAKECNDPIRCCG